MTIEELSNELGVSVHYINHHFKEIRGRLGRRGITLVKDGKGTTANYGIIENGASIARFEYKGLELSHQEAR
jgi:transcriptional antiterminator